MKEETLQKIKEAMRWDYTIAKDDKNTIINYLEKGLFSKHAISLKETSRILKMSRYDILKLLENGCLERMPNGKKILTKSIDKLLKKGTN